MTTQQMQCFITVASMKSYTRAAEALFLSQPTISREVTNLEKELGCQLLHRTTKQVEMTPAGEIFYRMFSSWHLNYREAKKQALQLSQDPAVTLSIGMLNRWVALPPMHNYKIRLQDIYPNIRISRTLLGPKSLADRLHNGKLDLVISLDHPLLQTAALSHEFLISLPMYFVLSRYHRLYDKEDLTISDLSEETFWLPDDPTGFFTAKLEQYCRSYNFFPNIQYVENIQTVRAYVQSGIGIGVFDEWGITCYSEMFRSLPLTYTEDVYLIWNPRVHAEARDVYIGELKKYTDGLFTPPRLILTNL